MKCTHHRISQILAKLHEAEIIIRSGFSVPRTCQKLKISEQTYFRWRKKYGQGKFRSLKQNKDLGKENA